MRETKEERKNRSPMEAAEEQRQRTRAEQDHPAGRSVHPVRIIFCTFPGIADVAERPEIRWLRFSAFGYGEDMIDMQLDSISDVSSAQGTPKSIPLENIISHGGG